MNWTNDNSIRLSKVCIIAFSVILLACDLVMWSAAVRPDILSELPGTYLLRPVMLVVCLYVLSIPAWVLLVNLWKLLSNIQKTRVFEDENVRRLRIISYCCAAAVMISAVGACAYLPLVFIAVAAAFMMLIVRIVKNVFKQAIMMKSELDLTI